MSKQKTDFAARLDDQPEDNPPQADAFKQTYGKPKLPAELRQMRKDRGWRFAADGLELKRELTREEFRDGLLNEVQAMGSAQQLIVGDAYLHGIECGFIETYEEMAELTGYEAGSIEVFASLCRSIPRLMRLNPLTFSHYQQIAPLPEDERQHWISFAAGSELSYRAVKALIAWTKAHRQIPTLPEATDGDIVAALESIPGVTVERVDFPGYPALSDENDDVTDDEIGDFLAPEHKQRRVDIEKKVKQNRWADIDLNDIIAEERRLKWLRKKVAAAKVEAGRQARMSKK